MRCPCTTAATGAWLPATCIARSCGRLGRRPERFLPGPCRAPTGRAAERDWPATAPGYPARRSPEPRNRGSRRRPRWKIASGTGRVAYRRARRCSSGSCNSIVGSRHRRQIRAPGFSRLWVGQGLDVRRRPRSADGRLRRSDGVCPSATFAALGFSDWRCTS